MVWATGHRKGGLDDLYDKAAGRARAAAEDIGITPRPLPDACPFALDELLAGHLSVAELIAKLDHGQAGDGI
jgi:hypothetical protein